jgi:hypothetical protein
MATGDDPMKRTNLQNLPLQRQLFFTALLAASLLYAPAAKAAGTYTAASCNQSDVNAVVNGPTHVAADGDTVIIPAGSCTWTSGVSVPSGVGMTIMGSGAPNTGAGTQGAGTSTTIITDSLTSGSLIDMTPTYGAPLSRISMLHLLNSVPRTGYAAPLNVVGTCTPSGCPNLRMDNITAPSSWAGLGIPDDTFLNVANMFGVADHNTIGDVAPSSNGVVLANVAFGSWQGVGIWGDNSWASPDTFGTDQAFYLENNVLNYAIGTDSDTYATYGGGARIVCRFNTFNSISSGGVCSFHGTDTTGRVRGGRQWEGYYNTGNCTSTTTGCGSAWPGRSGVGISFGNVFSNIGGGFFTGLTAIDAQRLWRPDSPWGGCDGTSPWDTNGGAVLYSGTVGSVATGFNNGDSAYTITDSGSPGWSANKWASKGGPSSFRDVTQGFGYAIGLNTANTLTTEQTGNSFAVNVPVAGDHYQILQVSACLDQPAHSGGELVKDLDKNFTSNFSGSPSITSTGSNLLANTTVFFSGLPSGFAIQSGAYFVLPEGLSANTFELSGHLGGPAISYSGTVTGVAGQQQSPVLVSSGVPGPVTQSVDPIYEADDVLPSTGHATIGSQTMALIANRDFYAESVNQAAQTSAASPFNGSSGTGHGTLANRPTTCTKGVGYLATDQGSWNQSNSAQQGELFVCTAANTWSLYYVPFTYPHPMTTGNADGAPPGPPTTLVVASIR